MFFTLNGLRDYVDATGISMTSSAAFLPPRQRRDAGGGRAIYEGERMKARPTARPPVLAAHTATPYIPTGHQRPDALVHQHATVSATVERQIHLQNTAGKARDRAECAQNADRESRLEKR